MADEREIEEKFWKALKEDRTVMLGLADGDSGHARPMTALLDDWEDQRGPIYIFTAKDTDLARSLGGGGQAAIHFSAKGHGLFASAEGRLAPYDDRSVLDRLWNPFVAAWYEGGKDDPKLLLLRFDAEEAQIWLNENSLFAGIRVLLGRDPKEDYKDKVAEIRLS